MRQGHGIGRFPILAERAMSKAGDAATLGSPILPPLSFLRLFTTNRAV